MPTTPDEFQWTELREKLGKIAADLQAAIALLPAAEEPKMGLEGTSLTLDDGDSNLG